MTPTHAIAVPQIALTADRQRAFFMCTGCGAHFTALPDPMRPHVCGTVRTDD